jgi:phosphoglycolate phosphatase-like HAD superfamily hydrolase
LTWAFDVDGTLVGSIRSNALRPGAVDLLMALAGRGVDCVLWSAGGAEYAHLMAVRHRIDVHFVACYAKAGRDADGRYLTDHFADADQPTVFVDDSPADLPINAQIIPVPQFLGNNPHDRGLVVVLADLDQHLLAAQA